MRRNNQEEIKIGPFRGTGKYGYKTKTKTKTKTKDKRQNHRTQKTKQMSSADAI